MATAIVAIALTMQACAPLAPRATRAAPSSLGCMRAALELRSLDSHSDELAHCMAAGLIALHCSTAEAWLASIGKELRDLFGSGNAEWHDLRADARGIRCARLATDECCGDIATQERLLACCVTKPSDSPATGR